MDQAEFSITVEGTAILVKLRGELDLQTAPHVADCLEMLRSDAIVDCSGLDFIDSTGLRTFIMAHQQFQASQDQLTFRNPPSQVRRVFELSGVDSVLNIEE